MDRTEKEQSISPSPESDTTNLSVQTIIAKQQQHDQSTTQQEGHINPSYLNSQIALNLENDDNDDGHLYNTPDLINPNINNDKTVKSENDIVKSKNPLSETVINSQNPNVPNVGGGVAGSASSSVTLIKKSNKSKLPINIWLGTIQLLLSVALTVLGGLVLIRAASLSNTGSGIWAGGICAITGALGVINVQRAQTGFLAVSLICVASSTLAIALTGIGLVRDYNVNASQGAISAGSGLLLTLGLHFLVSVLSVYYLAIKLCLRPNSNDQNMDAFNTANNSTYLSQQRVEQYFQSLAADGKLKNVYPAIIHRNFGKCTSEKNYGKDKFVEVWLNQDGKPVASPIMSHAHPRQVLLVPAGVRNGMPMMPMYSPQLTHSPPVPPMLYPHVPPGFIPYQQQKHQQHQHLSGRSPIDFEENLERIRMARMAKDRQGRRARRKSESDMEVRKAFTYTGLDRAIAESFLEQQQKMNDSNLGSSNLSDLGKCADVAM